ncbi:hypothetical protein EVAR_77884_1 [Eumeta japonica]|uniref:Uncharacterized protein n=1 Tax=Eumeta variegata TaxID=151549 RepID=A0A4C1TEC6_EUMVA|nr:hypothetical protein EVAR_77884_1 [Eumeta japonica]
MWPTYCSLLLGGGSRDQHMHSSVITFYPSLPTVDRYTQEADTRPAVDVTHSPARGQPASRRGRPRSAFGGPCECKLDNPSGAAAVSAAASVMDGRECAARYRAGAPRDSVLHSHVPPKNIYRSDANNEPMRLLKYYLLRVMQRICI